MGLEDNVIGQRNVRARHAIPALAVALAGLVAIAGGAGSAASAASGSDWSSFRHDQLHSGVSPDTTWGAAEAGGLKTKWHHAVGGGGHGKAGVDASPVVAFNATLATTIAYGISVLGVAHAFDAGTGATIWTQNVGPAVVSSPALDGNSLYFGTTRGQLLALDATTGAVQCSFQLPVVPPETIPGAIQGSPVVGRTDGSGPIVFFGDIGQTLNINAGHEWAITGFGNSAGGCKLKWVFDGWANKGPHGKKTGSWSSPALARDGAGRQLLVFGSSDPDDAVYALNAGDGAEVWRFQTQVRAGDQDVGAGPTIGAPGVNGFAHGVVYIDGKDKIEYALGLANGRQIWSFDMGADAGVKTNSVSTAALVGNNIVVGYAGYLYDLNATTGAKVWRTAKAAGLILASPSVSGASGDEVAFIGDLAGGFSAYRISDGALTFTINVKNKIRASAAIASGRVYFASDNGALYCLG